MHIFLTGATGYIGAAVLDALIKGGHKVTAMARDKEKAERLAAKGATPIVAELGLPKRYLAAVKAADAVVYCAYESSPRGVALEKQTLESMLATQARRRARPTAKCAPSSTPPGCGCSAAPSRRLTRARRSIRRRTCVAPWARRPRVVGVLGDAAHRGGAAGHRLWRRPRHRG